MESIELLNVGIFDSRVHFPTRKRTAWRTVARYEIDLFCEDGGIAYLNKETYPLKKGALLFARPGDLRRSDLHFTCRFLHFRVESQSLAALLETLPHFYSSVDLSQYEPLMTELVNQSVAPDGFECLHTSATLQKLLWLLHRDRENAEVESPATVTQSVLKAAKSYMENHFTEELDVPTVAAICNVSASYLHKLFRRHLGLGVHRYLLNCRLNAAELLLRTTDLPLSRIFEECGFTSQSYFTECFKRHRKIAPLVYRQQYAYPEE